MAANIDRFKDDLDRLIRQAQLLDHAMIKEISESEFLKQLRKQITDDTQIQTLLAALPDFKTSYEAWYSESLALIRQLLPDRLETFTSLYEKPKGRKSVEYGNYVIQDYMQSLKVTHPWGDTKVDPTAAVPQFRQQVAILNAVKTRFESSLFEIKQLVQADLFDSEIEVAGELLKNKFVRPAGVIAGVILEKHLRQVCDNHNIKITKKHSGIGDLNELLKSNSAIDIPQWRFISMLADIRNLCGHDKQREPTVEQVGDLINGVQKIVKTIS